MIPVRQSLPAKPVIAVAGASGFVGSHLMAALAGECHMVGLARTPVQAQSRAPGLAVEWRACDLFSSTSTQAALVGVDIAFYLVHSMMPSSRLFQGTFHDTDLLLADNFAKACAHNGVKSIVYLGGLVPHTGYVSPHLQSRLEVEGVLQSSGIPVTCLRAGMVVGPGGSSFEILRALVSRLPWMILPKWTRSAGQAVFLDDVVAVLKASVTDPALFGRTFDLVNGESLSYEDLLRQSAAALGMKRRMVQVPHRVDRVLEALGTALQPRVVRAHLPARRQPAVRSPAAESGSDDRALHPLPDLREHAGRDAPSRAVGEGGARFDQVLPYPAHDGAVDPALAGHPGPRQPLHLERVHAVAAAVLPRRDPRRA